MPEAIASGAPGSEGGHAARWARERQWATRSPRVSVQHHAEVSASGALRGDLVDAEALQPALERVEAPRA